MNVPKFGLCCVFGKIQIESIPDPPHELHCLLTGETSVSKYFLSNIRRFNAAMSMATMKAKDETVTGGASNIRISGVVYRMIGSPRSAENSQPNSLQTYFYDAVQQLQYRMKLYQQLEIERNIFRTLQQNLMKAPNTYLHLFLNIQVLMDKGTVPPTISIQIHPNKPDREYARRFNQPTTTEVSTLLPNQFNAESSESNQTVICTFRKDGDRLTVKNLQHFKYTHRSYDPLCYPILLPYGTDGFHVGILQTLGTGPTYSDNKTVLCIQVSEMYSFNILHHGNRLFQQCCVGMWANIEMGRLDYLRFNQQNLRDDVYSALQDAIHAGRRIILPASFTGGPRFMT